MEPRGCHNSSQPVLRQPFRKAAGKWGAGTGSRPQGLTQRVFLFTSKQLQKWQTRGPLGSACP